MAEVVVSKDESAVMLYCYYPGLSSEQLSSMAPLSFSPVALKSIGLTTMSDSSTSSVVMTLPKQGDLPIASI